MENNTVEENGILAALRFVTTTSYDFQKNRIMLGNRVIIFFKLLNPDVEVGKADASEERVADELLKSILKDFKSLMKGRASLPREGSFKPTSYITSHQLLVMVSMYMALLKEEERSFASLGSLLSQLPIYTKYLRDIVGVGNVTAAIMISYLNPHAARYPSSFVSYCGLDVVTAWPGAYLDMTVKMVKSIPKYTSGRVNTLGDFNLVISSKKGLVQYLEDVDGKLKWAKPYDFTDDKRLIEIFRKGNYLQETTLLSSLYERFDDLHDNDYAYLVEKDVDGNPRGFYACNEGVMTLVLNMDKIAPTDPSDEPFHKARGRYTDHLKTVTYTDKDGVEQTKRDLGYNPTLKAKLLGTIAPNFIRTKSPYTKVYYDYKHRLEQINDEKPEDERSSKSHIQKKCYRVMIKVFLYEFYRAYRELEGLEVHPTYEVAKLKMREHDTIYSLESLAAAKS